MVDFLGISLKYADTPGSVVKSRMLYLSLKPLFNRVLSLPYEKRLLRNDVFAIMTYRSDKPLRVQERNFGVSFFHT
jgi:hypothetical protein